VDGVDDFGQGWHGSPRFCHTEPIGSVTPMTKANVRM
jgi:hypothetical protein